jgi:DNA-binding NarL/FixJ family response regulator
MVMRGTKIMIVSNQHSFRIALRQAISKSAALEAIEIRECDRGEVNSDAIAEIMAISPDIVLLDIGYPVFNSLNLARKIAETFPRIGVILLSTNPEDDDNELFEAAKSRAIAYIIIGKQTADAELIEAIKQASSGERPIIDKVINNPEVARRILKRFQDMASMAGTTEAVAFPHNLDLEELEILQLIAKGHQRKQIASVLGVSEFTIGERVSSILFKLNSNERTLDLFTRVRASLLSIRLARDGNLFILNASPTPCQPQLLHDGAHRP